MIYEMRVYRCVPGRLPDLLKRFETITLALWDKHGIKQAGFWTTLVGESNQDLTYFVAWGSLAERDQKWGAFQADPGMDPQTGGDGGERADRREHQQRVPVADRLLRREVAWPSARIA